MDRSHSRIVLVGFVAKIAVLVGLILAFCLPSEGQVGPVLTVDLSGRNLNFFADPVAKFVGDNTSDVPWQICVDHDCALLPDGAFMNDVARSREGVNFVHVTACTTFVPLPGKPYGFFRNPKHQNWECRGPKMESFATKTAPDVVTHTSGGSSDNSGCTTSDGSWGSSSSCSSSSGSWGNSSWSYVDQGRPVFAFSFGGSRRSGYHIDDVPVVGGAPSY